MGRKGALYVSVVLIYVANITVMTSDTIAGLYAGRLIIGLGNGILMTFSQLCIQVATIRKRRLYIEKSLTWFFPQECSPARYRALMLGGFQFWTSFGSSSAQLLTTSLPK